MQILISAGRKVIETFHGIIINIWDKEEMTPDFRDAIIASLFKYKCNMADGRKYRGISLLSTVSKILARVVLNCLINIISEDSLTEMHSGFQPERSTVDMIFLLT